MGEDSISINNGDIQPSVSCANCFQSEKTEQDDIQYVFVDKQEDGATLPKKVDEFWNEHKVCSQFGTPFHFSGPAVLIMADANVIKSYRAGELAGAKATKLAVYTNKQLSALSKGRFKIPEGVVTGSHTFVKETVCHVAFLITIRGGFAVMLVGEEYLKTGKLPSGDEIVDILDKNFGVGDATAWGGLLVYGMIQASGQHYAVNWLESSFGKVKPLDTRIKILNSVGNGVVKGLKSEIRSPSLKYIASGFMSPAYNGHQATYMYAILKSGAIVLFSVAGWFGSDMTMAFVDGDRLEKYGETEWEIIRRYLHNPFLATIGAYSFFGHHLFGGGKAVSFVINNKAYDVVPASWIASKYNYLNALPSSEIVFRIDNANSLNQTKNSVWNSFEANTPNEEWGIKGTKALAHNDSKFVLSKLIEPERRILNEAHGSTKKLVVEVEKSNAKLSELRSKGMYPTYSALKKHVYIHRRYFEMLLDDPKVPEDYKVELQKRINMMNGLDWEMNEKHNKKHFRERHLKIKEIVNIVYTNPQLMESMKALRNHVSSAFSLAAEAEYITDNESIAQRLGEKIDSEKFKEIKKQYNSKTISNAGDFKKIAKMIWDNATENEKTTILEEIERINESAKKYLKKCESEVNKADHKLFEMRKKGLAKNTLNGIRVMIGGLRDHLTKISSKFGVMPSTIDNAMSYVRGVAVSMVNSSDAKTVESKGFNARINALQETAKVAKSSVDGFFPEIEGKKFSVAENARNGQTVGRMKLNGVYPKSVENHLKRYRARAVSVRVETYKMNVGVQNQPDVEFRNLDAMLEQKRLAAIEIEKNRRLLRNLQDKLKGKDLTSSQVGKIRLKINSIENRLSSIENTYQAVTQKIVNSGATPEGMLLTDVEQKLFRQELVDLKGGVREITVALEKAEKAAKLEFESGKISQEQLNDVMREKNTWKSIHSQMEESFKKGNIETNLEGIKGLLARVSQNHMAKYAIGKFKVNVGLLGRRVLNRAGGIVTVTMMVGANAVLGGIGVRGAEWLHEQYGVSFIHNAYELGDFIYEPYHIEPVDYEALGGAQ